MPAADAEIIATASSIDSRGSPSRHPGPLDFDAFYRDHYQDVARALAYTLGSSELAAEAADEAMTRAYQRWATVSRYDNPGGWVYRVGLNWARSTRQRLARRWPFSQPTAVTQPPLPDPAVRAALQSLSAPLRSVVVCRLLLDWSTEETARALGVRPGTVKSRLHRALRGLQSRLKHLEEA